MKNLLAVIALLGSAAYAANVTDIQVKALDGFGGDTSSVLTRCQTKVGSPYDEETVSRDVNSLKASKEFQDISVEARRTAEGVEVVFYVKRKMRYQAPMVVKGNSYFGESKIVKESGLKDGALYGEGDFAEAAAKVRRVSRRRTSPTPR